MSKKQPDTGPRLHGDDPATAEAKAAERAEARRIAQKAAEKRWRRTTLSEPARETDEETPAQRAIRQTKAMVEAKRRRYGEHLPRAEREPDEPEDPVERRARIQFAVARRYGTAVRPERAP